MISTTHLIIHLLSFINQVTFTGFKDIGLAVFPQDPRVRKDLYTTLEMLERIAVRLKFHVDD